MHRMLMMLSIPPGDDPLQAEQCAELFTALSGVCANLSALARQQMDGAGSADKVRLDRASRLLSAQADVWSELAPESVLLGPARERGAAFAKPAPASVKQGAASAGGDFDLVAEAGKLERAAAQLEARLSLIADGAALRQVAILRLDLAAIDGGL